MSKEQIITLDTQKPKITLPKDGQAVLMTPIDYWQLWVDILKNAREFAGIQAMNVSGDHMINSLIASLRQAASHGAIPFVAYDEIASLVSNENKLIRNPWKVEHEVTERNFVRASMINGHGDIQARELRPGGFFKECCPSQFCDHMKLTVTETYFGLPMFNLTDGSLKILDGGVTFSDGPTVEAGQRIFFDNFYDFQPNEDYVVPLPPYNFLMVDVGKKRGRSIIQDTYTDMLENSQQNFTHMSQYVPDPITTRQMQRKARQGVEIPIYTSPRNDRKFNQRPYAWFYNDFRRCIDQEEAITLHHHPNTYVHAKIALSDIELDPLGNVLSGKGMFGSHNYVRYGVWFGTAEIAMYTEDRNLLSQLVWFVRDFENQPRSIKNYLATTTNPADLSVLPSKVIFSSRMGF